MADSHGARATPRLLTSYDALKLIAILAMTIDHVGAYLLPDDCYWPRVIGRVAAPIFCFLVGWNGSYRWRSPLLYVALGVSLLEFLHHALFPLNILWVILLGRLVMQWMDQRARAEPAAVMIIGCVVWLPIAMLGLDYGTVGLMWMLLGRQQRRAPHSAAAMAYAFAALLATAAQLPFLLPMPLLPSLVALALMAATTVGLWRFTLREYAATPMPVGVYLARHALYYYGIHLAVIIGLSLVLGMAPSGMHLF